MEQDDGGDVRVVLEDSGVHGGGQHVQADRLVRRRDRAQQAGRDDHVADAVRPQEEHVVGSRAPVRRRPPPPRRQAQQLDQEPPVRDLETLAQRTDPPTDAARGGGCDMVAVSRHRASLDERFTLDAADKTGIAVAGQQRRSERS
jgi:hypothetical protein